MSTDDRPAGAGTRYARVIAEMRRAGWSRKSDHVAECGQLQGRGASIADALTDLGDQLTAMAGRANTAPAIWWDADNACLHIVTPDTVTGGHHAWIVAMGETGPRLSMGTSSGVAPVADALATSVGLERVTGSHGEVWR